jgi:hypothetical protein
MTPAEGGAASLGLYMTARRSRPGLVSLNHAGAINIDALLGLRNGGELGAVRAAIQFCRDEPVDYVTDPQDHLRTIPRDLWTGTRRFWLEALEGNHVEGEPGEGVDGEAGNPLSAEGVTSFLRWFLPASEGRFRMVVFWGHGGGPGTILLAGPPPDSAPAPASPAQRPEFRPAQPLEDDWLMPSELETGLCAGLAGERLDIAAFDACQEASIEIASLFVDRADWLVASQRNVPGLGWPYAAWPRALAATNDAQRVCENIVQAYGVCYPPDRCTLSAVSLAKVKELLPALGELSAALLADGSAFGTDGPVWQARAGSHLADGESVDLIAFTRQLAQTLIGRDAALAARCQALAEQSRQCVLALTPCTGCNGMSIYFPASAAAVTSRNRTIYFDRAEELSAFKQQTRWDRLLRSALGIA